MQPAQRTPLEVKVWGDFACFTRPEMKVERVSYPVMTPSAARGILEAIFWKPEFRWQVEEIRVLKPIRYFSILRNEINSRQSARTAEGWQRNGGGGRVQRGGRSRPAPYAGAQGRVLRHQGPGRGQTGS